MAKLRSNHRGDDMRGRGNVGNGPSKGPLRLIVGFLLVAVVLFLLSKVNGDSWDKGGDASHDTSHEARDGGGLTVSDEQLSDTEKSFLPESTTGDVIHHKHYSLSYDEDHEQAEWVAYKLTEESLRLPNVKRAKRFNYDKKVSSRSAVHSDYTRSGYTRGHMAPAGDMAFSIKAMQESFYMSNMSPQVKECNGGIWRELEETTRDWAFDHDELYVVSGPVLEEGHIITKIGKNRVSVPDLFYKIILDNKGPKKHAIAFLIPNEKSTKPLKDYIVSIDEVEALVGIDFFSDFLPEDQESALERSTSRSGWKFSTKRFENRVRNWNKR